MRQKLGRTITRSLPARLRWRDVFGQFIANTDRHLGNLFFHQDDPLDPGSLTALTPAYDMLPMALAPVSGRVSEPEFAPVRLSGDNIDVWAGAARAARAYWEAVASDKRIGRVVRDYAGSAAQAVEALYRRAEMAGLVSDGG